MVLEIDERARQVPVFLHGGEPETVSRFIAKTQPRHRAQRVHYERFALRVWLGDAVRQVSTRRCLTVLAVSKSTSAYRSPSGVQGEPVPGSVTWDPVERLLTWVPLQHDCGLAGVAANTLRPDTRYQVTLRGKAIRLAYNPVPLADATFGFRTRPAVFELVVRCMDTMKVGCGRRWRARGRVVHCVGRLLMYAWHVMVSDGASDDEGRR